MKNKNQAPQLDLVTPIIEIFHEVCMMIVKLVWELSQFIFNKITKQVPPLQKIDIKSLGVKRFSKNADSIGIDTKNKKEILLNDIDFNKHSFIVGASGFGKTNLISILQENSLKKNKPIIFFDPKGDLEALTTFKDLCQEYNKKCYIFSEFHEDSVSLNPLLEGTINQVADRITGAFEWSEQYYKDVSYRYLLKSLKYLKKKNIHFSLENIHEVLTEQYDCKDITGLIVKLESILESDFSKCLNGNSENLTISKIREEQACLYIGLSTQGYGETAKAIGKFFLGELLYNSYKTLNSNFLGKGLKNPISIYFDEFGSLVTPQFIELQNKCRGAGIELTLAVQTASDIDRIDKDLTKQIIENSSNIFVMKQRLAEGSSLFAETLGTIISKKQTFATENGEVIDKGTEREVHELLVHPEIIKNLKIGQCILLRHDPARINLINIRLRNTKQIKIAGPKMKQNHSSTIF